jgi:hypothetical protein
MARLDRSVRQLHRPDDIPPDDSGIRPFRDTDRGDSRPDREPTIGM